MDERQASACGESGFSVGTQLDWTVTPSSSWKNPLVAPLEAPRAQCSAPGREHGLSVPTTPVGRLLRRWQDGLERLVVRKSVLTDVPVYDPRAFPWASEVEAGWRQIRAELDAVMVFRDRMPSFHEILKEVGSITHDADWKTFFLRAAGMDCRENAQRCPATMRLIEKIPGATTAFFSILAPGKHIPAHRGAYNGVLRYHLGLIVPGPVGACRIRVADQMQTWSEGRSLIFDDSFNHEVWNDSEGWRVVLFVDFPRPLRAPWHRLNRAFIGLGPLAPFLREAGVRQRRWARQFYGGEKP